MLSLSKPRWSAVFFALALGIPAANAAVGVIESQIEMSINRGIATGDFVLKNNGPKKAVYEISFSTYEQRATGNQFKPTKDLYAIPQIIAIEGNSTQRIRVVSRRAPDPTRELTYRVRAAQVATADAPLSKGLAGSKIGAGIKISYAVSLPAYMPTTARRLSPKLSVNRMRRADGKTGLKIGNQGAHRAFISRIDTLDAAGQRIGGYERLYFQVNGKSDKFLEIKLENAAAVIVHEPSLLAGSQRILIRQ